MSTCDPQEEELLVYLSPYENMEIVSITDEQLAINVYSTGFDGCAFVHDLEKVPTPRGYKITVWAAKEMDAYCTMALVTLESEIQLDISGLDSCLLEFSLSDTTTADTLILL